MRIPALDGIRGIAILLVIFDHLQLGAFGHYVAFRTGILGVTLFFILSGYLITGNLMREGDLKRFYTRRFFRLMPAAWVYLALMTVLGVGYVLPALLFFRNFVDPHETALMTAHFWSLSIEEQFYLAWPVVLLLARKKAFMVASITFVGCLFFHGPYTATLHNTPFLLAGCLLALGGFTVPRMSLLEWKPLTMLGRMSYSLYLWQEITLRYPGFETPWSTPFRLGAMVLLAALSYEYIEQPMIRFGKRVRKPELVLA